MACDTWKVHHEDKEAEKGFLKLSLSRLNLSLHVSFGFFPINGGEQSRILWNDASSSFCVQSLNRVSTFRMPLEQSPSPSPRAMSMVKFSPIAKFYHWHDLRAWAWLQQHSESAFFWDTLYKIIAIIFHNNFKDLFHTALCHLVNIGSIVSKSRNL